MKPIKMLSSYELRLLADEILEESKAKRPQRAEHEILRTLHEFEVQKIELELQNQELQVTIDELEKAMLVRDELEKTVAERTTLLEAALREQESFSYAASHDLRTPLHQIYSYLDIVSEDFGYLLPPEAHKFLDRARATSIRMGKLIDDLLELSQIGRTNLAKETVNLSDLAMQVCEGLSESEPDRTVEFVINDGLLAEGDKSLLQQIMGNLLGNAWKYTSKKPAARIEFGRVSDANRDIFYVKDNGIGFDMAYGDKLFGAFQRLHGSEYKGNGIGLATVKRIVERHGGEVWADSKVNEGATFYFSL